MPDFDSNSAAKKMREFAARPEGVTKAEVVKTFSLTRYQWAKTLLAAKKLGVTCAAQGRDAFYVVKKV